VVWERTEGYKKKELGKLFCDRFLGGDRTALANGHEGEREGVLQKKKKYERGGVGKEQVAPGSSKGGYEKELTSEREKTG